MPEPQIKITDSNSDRVQALLDRIEQNYGRLDERLDELEELVPVTLERMQRSMQGSSSHDGSSQDSSHADSSHADSSHADSSHSDSLPQKSSSPGKPR